MPLVPQDPWALAVLAITLAGTAFLTASQWPKAYGLGIIILAIFGIEVLSDFSVIPWTAYSTPAFLAGYWWTPFTYMFLHAGVGHIAGNLLILLTAGPLLEDRIGSWRFLAIYFAAGFAAVGAQVALESLDLIRVAPSVGASGAVFGILTVLAMRWPRVRIPFPVLIIIWLPAFVVLLIHLVFNLALMVSGPTNVAWYGHFAGYLVGLAASVFVKADGETPKARGGLPDVNALRPLARDREMEEFLEKAQQFTGEDQNDVTFALSWIDRFIARAECPNHHVGLERKGRVAACPQGDFAVKF